MSWNSLLDLAGQLFRAADLKEKLSFNPGCSVGQLWCWKLSTSGFQLSIWFLECFLTESKSRLFTLISFPMCDAVHKKSMTEQQRSNIFFHPQHGKPRQILYYCWYFFFFNLVSVPSTSVYLHSCYWLFVLSTFFKMSSHKLPKKSSFDKWVKFVAS